MAGACRFRRLSRFREFAVAAGGFGLLALLVAAGPARAETLVVSGVPLELTPPPGFCRLAPESPGEVALIDWLIRRDGENLRAVLTFADCQELDDLRAGRRTSVTALGQLGGRVAGGEAVRVDNLVNFFRDLRSSHRLRSAAEAMQKPGTESLLVDGAGFIVHGGPTPGEEQIHVGSTAVIGGVAVELSLYLASAGSAEQSARALADGAGQLAQATSELLAVNDIFDEAEKVATYNQAGSLNQMTAILAGLGFISLISLRSLWLLLRAPRRRA